MKELFNANGYFKKFDVKIFFVLPFFGIDNKNNKLKVLKVSMSLTTQKRTKYCTRAV